MTQKLIVVSMDALVYEDLEYLSQKPNFKAFMASSAMVRRVRSIYPTLTYPCHATMATGTLPAKHGIVNNYIPVPGQENGPWKWFHESYQVKDLFDACKEAGLTTACVGWPTMGNHTHIDWLVAEIAGTPAKTVEEFHRDYSRTGTPEALWEEICLPHIHWRTEHKRVAMFNTHACCEIIRRYAPDLTLLHVADPDNSRHKNGVFSEAIYPALDECDKILGMLRQAIADSGQDINLVITADHGQLDVKHTCAPNALLVEGGFITPDETGAVTSWRAWCHGAGMSSQVYVKDPADEQAVYEFFKKHEGQYGYEKIYTRQECLDTEGLTGDFAFVLETDGVTHLQNSWLAPISAPGGKVKGTHGYHPDKGPRPPLLAVGPAFRIGVVLEDARLADGAPTWAHILGVSLPDADGTILQDLLR